MFYSHSIISWFSTSVCWLFPVCTLEILVANQHHDTHKGFALYHALEEADAAGDGEYDSH